MGLIDRFYAGEKSYSIPFIATACCIVTALVGIPAFFYFR